MQSAYLAAGKFMELDIPPCGAEVGIWSSRRWTQPKVDATF